MIQASIDKKYYSVNIKHGCLNAFYIDNKYYKCITRSKMMKKFPC